MPLLDYLPTDSTNTCFVDYHFLGDASRAIFNSLGEQPLVFEYQPTLLGYVAFFASLFAFRNWQDMVSPVRKHRFSVTAVLVTVFVAWLATTVFAFPAQIAIAWAVMISCVAQLAAPIRDQSTTSHSRKIA